MTLLETQRWLAAVVLAPSRLDDAGVRDEIRAHVDTGALGDLHDARDLDVTLARLRAYTGGYPARLRAFWGEPALPPLLGICLRHCWKERRGGTCA